MEGLGKSFNSTNPSCKPEKALKPTLKNDFHHISPIWHPRFR